MLQPLLSMAVYRRAGLREHRCRSASSTERCSLTLSGVSRKATPASRWRCRRRADTGRWRIRASVGRSSGTSSRRTRGRLRRGVGIGGKARRKRTAVDVRVLPSPGTVVALIDAIPSHQPSRIYQVMTAVAYYAGLRPSEVVMLRPRALRLSATGWGSIEVVEADIDLDEPGEPKTADRTVPIPPRRVELLRLRIEEHALGNDDLLFRTRNDRRPAPSNWSRTLRRACVMVGHRPLRVYDLRHAAATTWLRAGVPLGEVARRLGHSVETLVSTYVGALQGRRQGRQHVDRLGAGDDARADRGALGLIPCSSRDPPGSRATSGHWR